MKDKNVAALLAIFFGGLGIHKFYLNRPIQGIIYFVFCWTFIPSVVAFFEGLTYLLNPKAWFDQKYNPTNVTFITSNEGPVQELEKIATLYEKGYLTRDEFELKKLLLLKKIA